MTHGDMERGGRHGDDGLDIGRKGMAPIFDFINEASDQPFFLWYAPFMPHTPHNPPKRLFEKYRDKTESVHLARYWAMCEWFDETCGELLDFLDHKGLCENTMIVYVCDNGWIQRPDSDRYAERSKRTPYECGVRTPTMVKWPGKATPKRDEKTPVSSVDIAPTILNAIGLQPTAEMQGVNLLDENALKSRSAVMGAAYTHDTVDIEQPLSSLKYTYIIDGEWKLIQPSGRNESGLEAELYRINNDPDEMENVAQANRDIVEQLQKRIDEWLPGSLPG